MYGLLRLRPLLLTAAVLALGAAQARSQGVPRAAESVPGEVIFKLRPSAFESGGYRSDLAPQGRTGLPAVDQELTGLSTSLIGNVFNVTVNPARKHEGGMDRILLARYTGAPAPLEAAARLARLPEIEWAEPNWIGQGALAPDDPTYPLQWAHHNRGQAIAVSGDSVGTWDADGDTDLAWDIQTGSISVVIAVIDTGIDRGHPEFSGKVLAGWDFVNSDADPTDDHGHGTACAGIASARGNNGQGVAGVAWGNAILPVKVLGSNNQGTTANMAAGIEYAADLGAEVLSMSVGLPASSTLRQAIVYADDAQCAMFAASGNDNASSLAYPAAYYEVEGVGALSPCNERKSPTSCDGETGWGSNYGLGLELMAPGVRIHTTDIRGAGGYSNGDYTSTFNGTSAATPFAAGVAALVLSQVNLTPSQLAAILADACDDLGAPGYDFETGNGRLNAYVALRKVTGAVFVGRNPGIERGTYAEPYHTVAAGVNAVPVGNFVIVKPGDYDEATPYTITKILHLEAIDGGVTVR